MSDQQQTNGHHPVRMRAKKIPLVDSNGSTEPSTIEQTNGSSNGSTVVNGSVLSALQRGMDALYEAPADVEDSNEEIRKLDAQLDHLNDYMDKVDLRLKQHHEKLTETLRHQKEEREKRRRSFQERMATNQQEDSDFQRQMAAILNRVDSQRNRQSVYEFLDMPNPAKSNQ